MDRDERLRRIDAALKRIGLSDTQVSIRVTGKPHFIRNLRRGTRKVDAANLAKLADVLDVPHGYLLDACVSASEQDNALWQHATTLAEEACAGIPPGQRRAEKERELAAKIYDVLAQRFHKEDEAEADSIISLFVDMLRRIMESKSLK